MLRFWFLTTFTLMVGKSGAYDMQPHWVITQGCLTHTYYPRVGFLTEVCSQILRGDRGPCHVYQRCLDDAVALKGQQETG